MSYDPKSGLRASKKSNNSKKSRGQKIKSLNQTTEIAFHPGRQFESVPVDLRARIKTNQVDILRDQARAFNGIKQPRWDKWPLECKVPDIRNRVWPIGSVYYTRGKVGQQLTRKPPRRIPKMKTNDPQGEYAPSKSYSALHDPHAKTYFEIPEVKKLLHKNRLVNDKNEVICSIKEYNQFRKYLSTFENETIHDKLHNQADVKQFHKEVQLPFTQYMKHKEHPAVLHGRRSQREVRDERSRAIRQDIQRRKENYEARMENFKKMQQTKILNSIAEGQAKEARAYKKRMVLETYHLQMRRDILHNAVADMGQAVTNKKDYTKMMKYVKEQMQKERALARQTFEDHDTELMQVVREAVRRQKKHWLVHYEKRLNAATQTLEYLRAAAEQKRKRERFLERKYYDLWRAYIKNTRHRACTPSHTSLFRVEHDMRRMVEWLDQETGYDLVMAVVRKTMGQGTYHIRAHFDREKHVDSHKMDWSRKNSRKTSLGHNYFSKTDNGDQRRKSKSDSPNSPRKSKSPN